MIRIIDTRIAPAELAELCRAHYDTMVKFVADVEQEILAAGGELHSDAEALLLEQGSQQGDLWGGNFYPWKEPDQRIEFTSFINIRPADENPSMEVLDAGNRTRIVALIEKLLLPTRETMPEAVA
ncbi:MAG TPA: DUF5674 family protein [bacterium]|nr:DUF5674 family protein [bacterium]HPR89276.1 DUF5674 family protein [bacterium]